jgi:hypothetical protein
MKFMRDVAVITVGVVLASIVMVVLQLGLAVLLRY